MKGKLLILGAGEMQVPIIKKAREMGYDTLVADYNKDAPGIKYASRFFEVSTLDKDAILKIATEEQITGILTTSDAPVRVVSYVGTHMNIPCMTEEVSEVCTNKYLQRTIFQKNGINCPKFTLRGRNDIISDLTNFPYIVKPLDSSASRGVTRVNNSKELEEAINESLTYSKKENVIIESFIEGREFSVETLTQNNKTSIIAITEKLTCGEDQGYFVENTHIIPARISENERELIETEVKKAIKTIGINNCPTHTEIKINKRGAFIIEIACRLGGDYITSDLVPLATGVDMLENLIKLSVGNKIDIQKRQTFVSAVKFITPDNYYNCQNYISEGDVFLVRYHIEPYEDRIIKNSIDRLGYIILQCPEMSQLEIELSKLS